MKTKLKQLFVKFFLSYDNNRFLKELQAMGITQGDVVMVHSSWLTHNGFKGRPIDMINCLKQLVGESGLLIMPSLSYQNESTRDYLLRNKAMNVKRAPSMMGLLSEVFRRGKDSLRSLSPTHPLVAWGKRKQEFVAGHETCSIPFGDESPFSRLLDLNGKILTIDVPFSTITFTHFLENRIASSLVFPLYEDKLMIGKLLDYSGLLHEIPVKVLSQQANSLRREQRLVDELDQQNLINRKKVGNTDLMLIDCQQMTACVDGMVKKGNVFFDSSA